MWMSASRCVPRRLPAGRRGWSQLATTLPETLRISPPSDQPWLALADAPVGLLQVFVHRRSTSTGFCARRAACGAARGRRCRRAAWRGGRRRTAWPHRILICSICGVTGPSACRRAARPAAPAHARGVELGRPALACARSATAIWPGRTARDGAIALDDVGRRRCSAGISAPYAGSVRRDARRCG